MKSYTNYTEENGEYYKQNMVWWDKGGYFIPQARKEITEEEYRRKANEDTRSDGSRV